MFRGGAGRPACAYCRGPMGLGMYVFCCNECQRFYHRERGTWPHNYNKAEFRQLLREQKAMLDEHERKVKGVR